MSIPMFIPDAKPSRRKKRRLALCVQPMLYVNHDISLRLVEWMEVLRQQKYDKIFLYIIDVHPNITRVNHIY